METQRSMFGAGLLKCSVAWLFVSSDSATALPTSVFTTASKSAGASSMVCETWTTPPARRARRVHDERVNAAVEIGDARLDGGAERPRNRITPGIDDAEGDEDAPALARLELRRLQGQAGDAQVDRWRA